MRSEAPEAARPDDDRNPTPDPKPPPGGGPPPERPRARLILGDTLAWMKTIEAASVDAVIADPPYGTTECAWDSVIPFEPMWAELLRVLKPGGCAVMTACQPFTTDLVNSNRRWFRYALVWDKVVSTGWLDANRRPMRGHEDVLVFAKGRTTYNPQFGEGRPYRYRHSPRRCETLGAKKALDAAYETVSDGRRYPRSIVRFENANGRGKRHPTEKPLALFRWLVRTFTDPGETVLDHTMGSGTTVEAAALEGRHAIGIERHRPYFDHAVARARSAGALVLIDGEGASP